MAAIPRILVTGGAGYIGSHTVVELLQAGFAVTVMDDLSNASAESLKRVREITQCEEDRLAFFEANMCKEADMERVFESASFLAVIHFAGLKAVGESVQKPIDYYQVNIGGTLLLLQAMQKYGCKKIVFSSSATVYGERNVPPLHEKMIAGAGVSSPYGKTKYMIEEILTDTQKSPAGSELSVIILRYFNPVGAHPSGKIGEDPHGIPNNLMPYISQVVVGRRKELTVFGRDYDTPDGTGVRDYIHVQDLAQGHVAAINYAKEAGACCETFNLGSGVGCSVLELLKAMEDAVGKPIAHKFGDRRGGDVAVLVANVEKAATVLKWKTKLSIQDVCRDTTKWQMENPNGYQTETIFSK